MHVLHSQYEEFTHALVSNEWILDRMLSAIKPSGAYWSVFEREQDPKPEGGRVGGVSCKSRNLFGSEARWTPMWPAGSIHRLCVTCGVNLLVLYSASRGFSPGTPAFFLSS